MVTISILAFTLFIIIFLMIIKIYNSVSPQPELLVKNLEIPTVKNLEIPTPENFNFSSKIKEDEIYLLFKESIIKKMESSIYYDNEYIDINLGSRMKINPSIFKKLKLDFLNNGWDISQTSDTTLKIAKSE